MTLHEDTKTLNRLLQLTEKYIAITGLSVFSRDAVSPLQPGSFFFYYHKIYIITSPLSVLAPDSNLQADFLQWLKSGKKRIVDLTVKKFSN